MMNWGKLGSDQKRWEHLNSRYCHQQDTVGKDPDLALGPRLALVSPEYVPMGTLLHFAERQLPRKGALHSFL